MAISLCSHVNNPPSYMYLPGHFPIPRHGPDLIIFQTFLRPILRGSKKHENAAGTSSGSADTIPRSECYSSLSPPTCTKLFTWRSIKYTSPESPLPASLGVGGPLGAPRSSQTAIQVAIVAKETPVVGLAHARCSGHVAHAGYRGWTFRELGGPEKPHELVVPCFAT